MRVTGTDTYASCIMWTRVLDVLKHVMWTGIVLLMGLIVGFVASGRISLEPAAVSPPTEPADSNFAAVAARVLPAVVSVDVRRFFHHPPVEFGGDSGFDDDATPVPSSGSGFFYDLNGHVLTNHHVVDGASKIWVHLADGRQLVARLVGSDPETDVAVLEVQDATSVEPVRLGNSDEAKIGDWVAAVGNPLGYLSGSFTVGVISGKGRNEISIRGGSPTYQDFIQTDASIHFGNSGGPLVDDRGSAIGINTAFGGAGSGIGFAIPINMASEIASALLTQGRVSRGYLGVTLQEIDPDLAHGLGVSGPGGALIREVYPGTPAARAGLSPGDVVLEFNGVPVANVSAFRLEVARASSGRTLELRLHRFGALRTAQVELVERPFPDTHSRTEYVQRQEPTELGLFVSQVPDSFGEGVVIDSVAVGGFADEAGLSGGDVVLELDGKELSSANDLFDGMERATRAGRPAICRISRGGASWYVAVATVPDGSLSP